MSNDPVDQREHAIVIGGSLAGLLAARVLSDHFARVTILERDPVPDDAEARKGQPQALHLHALLASGFDIIRRFFPGIEQALAGGGAIVGDAGELGHWYHFGGFKVQCNTGLIGVSVSRPFLEWHVRRRVVALPNVTLRSSCAVNGLSATADRSRVSGVQLSDRADGHSTETLAADLVVDASGRGSATPHWLASLGYEKPSENEVKVRVGYATRLYRRRPDDVRGELIQSTPPAGKRAAFIFPIEPDRWIITASGFHGDHPPADEAGFVEFVRTLPVPNVYDVIRRSEPLSDIQTYKYAASLRRRYDRLKRFPEGYVVIGDAFASFNPIYGQGMTSAAMQAVALDEVLRQRGTTPGLWRPFFKRAAQVANRSWQLAAGEDFRYPETEGQRPAFVDLINAYSAQVHMAAHHDPVVYSQFWRVMNLLDSRFSLASPRIALRVLFALARGAPPSTF